MLAALMTLLATSQPARAQIMRTTGQQNDGGSTEICDCTPYISAIVHTAVGQGAPSIAVGRLGADGSDAKTSLSAGTIFSADNFRANFIARAAMASTANTVALGSGEAWAISEAGVTSSS